MFFIVECDKLNKCLLSLQRQMCPPMPATKKVSVWN